MSKRVRLSRPERSLLTAVRLGADIYERPDAEIARKMERRGLCVCVEPQMVQHAGEGREPYFGCVATALGKQALKGYVQAREKAPRPKPKRKRSK